MNSQNNDQLSGDQLSRINKFLKALPHLELSDKGLENVAKKFGVTAAVIKLLAEKLKLNHQIPGREAYDRR